MYSQAFGSMPFDAGIGALLRFIQQNPRKWNKWGSPLMELWQVTPLQLQGGELDESRDPIDV